MPSPDVAWLEDFKSVFIAVLESCSTENLYRSSQIDRTSWRARLDGKALTTPFYAFDIGQEVEETEFVAMDSVAFRIPFSFFSVYSTSDPGASIAGNGEPPYDIATYLMAQAAAARDGLLAYGGANFQVYPGAYPLIDCGNKNEPNTAFVQGNTPQAGSVIKGVLLVGKSY